MSGEKLFLDTNIIIYLLSGDETIADLIDQKIVYVSFVTQLELLGYQHISYEEISRVREFLSECVIVDINGAIKNMVIDLRRKYNLKLPDCIIIATALHLDLPFITSDKEFNKVDELETVIYEKD